MKNTLLRTVVIFVALCIYPSIHAYDFEYDGFYYDITSDSTVSVTYEGSTEYEYEGDIIIPEKATFNNKTYQVTEIGSLAFLGCNIGTISIPNNIIAIREGAFTSSSLDSIDIGSGVLTIEPSAFIYCTLGYINIPDNVTRIGHNAFYASFGLETVIFGNGVTQIEQSTFRKCNHLVSLKLGTGVTDIFYGAFRAAPLKEIYASSTIPPIAYHTNSYTDTFDADIFNQCTLYVPAGSLQAYKNAEVWKNFKNIVENDFTGIERPLPDKAKIFGNKNSIAFRNIEPDTDISIYDTTGKCIKTFVVDGDCEIPFPSGIYLIKYAGRTVKIIL